MRIPGRMQSAVEAEMIFATRYPAIHAHLASHFVDRLMNRYKIRVNTFGSCDLVNIGNEFETDEDNCIP